MNGECREELANCGEIHVAVVAVYQLFLEGNKDREKGRGGGAAGLKWEECSDCAINKIPFLINLK